MAATTPKQLTRKGGKSAPTVKQRIYLTYPPPLIKEPLIYLLGKQFDLRTNLRGANISETMGLVALEVEGTPPPRPE